tara:strand:- start:268 stop:1443 length:1176 start_codon:yes stop_codon:yes gene_type:complete
MSGLELRPNLAARNANPFRVSNFENAVDKYQSKKLYENLDTRIEPIKKTPEKEKVTNAINALKARIGNSTYTADDFGRLELVEFSKLVINIDNQRDVDWDHVAHIITTFDPRAVQIVNTIKLPDGNYSIPEGMHTVVALYILMIQGVIPADYRVMCKVVDALATVPGSDIKGEAFGNWLFRIINYKGRKAVAQFFMHKSRVSGVRNYNSNLVEDIHAEKIQCVVEDNNMYCRPAIEAKGNGAKPGMITHIAGLNTIAGLENDDFDESIKDLEFALSLHDRHFPNEKGIDGGWILTMGRYHAHARKDKITITREWQDALMKFFKEKYASPTKFHKGCQRRLTKFNNENNIPGGWNNSCLVSVLILDFYTWCEANNENFPPLGGNTTSRFAGI